MATVIPVRFLVQFDTSEGPNAGRSYGTPNTRRPEATGTAIPGRSQGTGMSSVLTESELPQHAQPENVLIPVKKPLSELTVRDLELEFLTRIAKRYPRLLEAKSVAAMYVAVSNARRGPPAASLRDDPRGPTARSESGASAPETPTFLATTSPSTPCLATSPMTFVRLDATMNGDDTLDCFLDDVSPQVGFVAQQSTGLASLSSSGGLCITPTKSPQSGSGVVRRTSSRCISPLGGDTAPALNPVPPRTPTASLQAPVRSQLRGPVLVFVQWQERLSAVAPEVLLYPLTGDVTAPVAGRVSPAVVNGKISGPLVDSRLPQVVQAAVAPGVLSSAHIPLAARLQPSFTAPHPLLHSLPEPYTAFPQPISASTLNPNGLPIPVSPPATRPASDTMRPWGAMSNGSWESAGVGQASPYTGRYHVFRPRSPLTQKRLAGSLIEDFQYSSFGTRDVEMAPPLEDFGVTPEVYCGPGQECKRPGALLKSKVPQFVYHGYIPLSIQKKSLIQTVSAIPPDGGHKTPEAVELAAMLQRVKHKDKQLRDRRLAFFAKEKLGRVELESSERAERAVIVSISQEEKEKLVRLLLLMDRLDDVLRMEETTGDSGVPLEDEATEDGWDAGQLAVERGQRPDSQLANFYRIAPQWVQRLSRTTGRLPVLPKGDPLAPQPSMRDILARHDCADEATYTSRMFAVASVSRAQAREPSPGNGHRLHGAEGSGAPRCLLRLGDAVELNDAMGDLVEYFLDGRRDLLTIERKSFREITRNMLLIIQLQRRLEDELLEHVIQAHVLNQEVLQPTAYAGASTTKDIISATTSATSYVRRGNEARQMAFNRTGLPTEMYFALERAAIAERSERSEIVKEEALQWVNTIIAEKYKVERRRKEA